MKISKAKLEQYMADFYIEDDFELLLRMAKVLKLPEPHIYALNERADFNRMLEGEISIKKEYIRPLERIFGISIARLVEEDNHDDRNQDFLPYLKGFRYYVYKDDPKLYEEEFKNIMTMDMAHPVITNYDEFGHTFFDYVVLYRALNAIKFLRKNYNLRATPASKKYFEIDVNGSRFMLPIRDKLEVAKLLLEKEEYALFYEIFDFTNYQYRLHFETDSVYNSNRVPELLLSTVEGYASLYQMYENKHTEVNPHVNVSLAKSGVVKRVNPLINKCLEYGLKHLDKYRMHVVRILDFGIQYNTDLLEKCRNLYGYSDNQLHMNGYGDLFDDRNILIGNLVFYHGSPNQFQDHRVSESIKKLPSVEKR